jgi:hypothetical protein
MSQLMGRQAVAYLTALLITAGAAVALAATNQPLEYLDEETGATVTVVGRPLVFVHDRSGFLGPAGDYVTVAAAAVNQSGKITYVLIAYFWWSGVPPKGALAPAAADPLALQADDRGILLVLRGTAREAGIGQPVHPPRLGAATPYAYAIDLPTMRFIAESHQLAVHIESEGTSPLNYELFEDRRVALKEFMRRMNGND